MRYLWKDWPKPVEAQTGRTQNVFLKAILDPTSDPQTFTLTKMGIDATRPTGRDFAERLTISDDQRARARSILEAAGVRL